MAEQDFCELVHACLCAAISVQDNARDLHAIMAGNTEGTDILKTERPDLLADLRDRYTLRRAHLFATGRAEPPPDDPAAPPPLSYFEERAAGRCDEYGRPAPKARANGVRRRA